MKTRQSQQQYLINLKTKHTNKYVRGAFGKFLAWSFISVTDL